MLSWKRNAITLASLVVSLGSPAVAQVENDQRLALRPIAPVLFPQADSAESGKLLYDACDNDFDGAILGGLIGGSPAVIGLILAGLDETGGERYIPWVYAGILGGIAGFVIGLGVDSANCHNQSEYELGSTAADQLRGGIHHVLSSKENQRVESKVIIR